MYCPRCGKPNTDDALFCAHCGGALPRATNPASAAEPIGFGGAIARCMGQYATFRGRAPRAEYWWFYLFALLLGWGALIVDRSGVVASLTNLALLLPSLAVTARRLHDSGRSAWWMLIGLTLIGLIPLFIWLARRGDPQPNAYGDPA